MDLPSKYGVSVLLSPCRLLQLWHHLVSGSVVLLSFLWGLNLSPSSFIDGSLFLHWKTVYRWSLLGFSVPVVSLDFCRVPFKFFLFAGWSHLLLSCSSCKRYFMSFTISQRTVSVYHILPMKRIFLQIVWGISVISLTLLNFFPNVVLNTMKLK